MGGGANVTQSKLDGLNISGAGEVRNISSKGAVNINGNGALIDSTIIGDVVVSSGVISNTVVAGSASITSGEISGCSLTGGSITAGSGSTITRNSSENSPGWAIMTTGMVTMTPNMVVGAVSGIRSSTGSVEYNLLANIIGNGLEVEEVAVRYNTFTGIGGSALVINTSMPTAIAYNNFEFNIGTYDIYDSIPKTTILDVSAQGNWWGTTDNTAIKARIYDGLDGDISLSRVNVGNPLSAPEQTAPAYVRGVNTDPPSPVGIQSVNFEVQFTRPMDTRINPVLEISHYLPNTWVKLPDLSNGRIAMGATSANGLIYAIGGRTWTTWSVDLVEVYNPVTNAWGRRANLPAGKHALAAVTAPNGMIYAIGGCDNNGLASKAVFEYNPRTDTWTRKNDMPSPRAYFNAVLGSNGKIYAVGGFSPDFYNITASVDEYDPATDTWTSKAAMPSPRVRVGLVATKSGKIYAIGGLDTSFLADVLEYDIEANSWVAKTSMPTARHALGAYIDENGLIYAIGGENNSSFASVEEYNPGTDSWKIMPNLSMPRSYLSVVAMPFGGVYLLGGVNERLPGSTAFLSLVEGTQSEKFKISNSSYWLDPTHYRSSYDFSVLNPKGGYSVIVSGAQTTDGMMIVPNTNYTLTFEYAGAVGGFTPPPAPVVTAWGNGTLTSLFAQMVTNVSNITGRQYAIGTTPEGTDIVGWTDFSGKAISRSGLNLLSNVPYYISVKVRNAGNLWSDPGVSNSIANGSLPIPSLISMNPSTIQAGSTGFTLVITGTNFTPASVIRWNGNPLTTIFVDPNHLSASVIPEKLATEGSFDITVYNPSPGGGETSPMAFMISPKKVQIFLPMINR